MCMDIDGKLKIQVNHPSHSPERCAFYRAIDGHGQTSFYSYQYPLTAKWCRRQEINDIYSDISLPELEQSLQKQHQFLDISRTSTGLRHSSDKFTRLVSNLLKSGCKKFLVGASPRSVRPQTVRGNPKIRATINFIAK